MRKYLFVLVAFAICGVTSAEGQQNYAIPQSPAFSYLEISPTKVERPTTARDFGAGLANGIDPDGRVRQGLAVEATPWPWLPGASIPASSYGEISKYMLANLSISIGSARAAGDTASTDLAFGARTTIVDRSDPMADSTFRASLRAANVKCNSTDPDATDESIRACIAASNTELRKKFLADHWNATSFSVAIASGVEFNQSLLKEGSWSGLSGWGSLALPLTTKGQLMVQARIDHHASLDTVPSSTSWRTGMRAVFGSSILNGFFEMEHNSKPAVGVEGKTGYSGGIEFRATDEMWISTGFGKGYSTSNDDKVVVLANIRWRINAAPRLQP